MNTAISLSTLLFILMHCGPAQASPVAMSEDNREFIRAQESFSNQLRKEQKSQLRGILEKQIQQAPISEDDAQFINELKMRQENIQTKKTSGAFYFVSFSIPDVGLKRMLKESSRFKIPATLRGMVNNDMNSTTKAVMSLVSDGVTSGVIIDPNKYREFRITSVPTLVVFCETGHDVIKGNLHLKESLKKIVEKGECKKEANTILERGEGDA